MVSISDMTDVLSLIDFKLFILTWGGGINWCFTDVAEAWISEKPATLNFKTFSILTPAPGIIIKLVLAWFLKLIREPRPSHAEAA